jgi:FKBP-type peptidyl-prolyl cis-trans isomerase FkpA
MGKGMTRIEARNGCTRPSPGSGRVWILVGLMAGLLLLAGCIGEVITEPDRSPDITEVEFHPELIALGVDLSRMVRSDLGVWRRDLEVGSGPSVIQETQIRLDFHGWLPDGQTFRSTASEQPTHMTVGAPTQDLYIPVGMQEGLLGMRAGGQRLILVPPSLGYGRSGWEGIVPGNSWLVYQLDLLEIVSGGHDDEDEPSEE